MEKNEPLEVYNPAYRKSYYLYSGCYVRPDGKTFTYYYFSGAKNAGALDALPDGYEIAVSPRSQMFFLKKKSSKKKSHVKTFS